MSILRPKRKDRLSSFRIETNFLTGFLLAALFLTGCMISLRLDLPGLLSYVLLWALSYFVLFAGACKHCVYYGSTCPVPLEGSCVHYFFQPGKDRFGYGALFWATIAYVLRVCIPVYLIFSHKLIVIGAVYLSILSAFWIAHLRFTGCPNCINYQCPLNPEQER
jgi:hypothetical protein